MFCILQILQFIVLSALFLHNGESADAKDASKITWNPVPVRVMEEGFASLKRFNTTMIIRRQKPPMGAINDEGKLERRSKAGPVSQESFLQVNGANNRIVSGSITNQKRVASLIKDKKDIPALFDFNQKNRQESAILIENQCKSRCNITVRCISQFKDTGTYALAASDIYILKFINTLPQGFPFNEAVMDWVCEVENLNTGRRIRSDAFGRKAKRQLFNLFEIRDKGLWHLDKTTGNTDPSVPTLFW